jgi:PAS domain S-box-containing protein
MTPRPLRNILLLQPLLTFAVSLAIAALLGYYWILPQINADIERQQLLFARAVSYQVDSYLETSLKVIESVSSRLLDNTLPPDTHQNLLNDMVRNAGMFSAIYLVDYRGQVLDVGLLGSNSFRTRELLNTNLAGNPIFKGTRPDSPPRWSETFLSLVTGGLSAAHLTPVSNGVVIAETDMGKLTGLLKLINLGKETIILILDRKGQVISDRDGRFTAVQMNISNLPLVRTAVEQKVPASGLFEFEGKRMIGGVVPIPSKGWHALVASTLDSAYSIRLATDKALVLGFFIAVLISMALSYILARHLSRRFEDLAARADAIAVGRRDDSWPLTPVAEFNQLSDSLQEMARSLDMQHETLRRNERRLSLAISATADAVWEWNIITGETYYSPRWYEMLGYDAGRVQMTFESFKSLVHPDDVASVIDQIRLSLASRGGPAYAAEFRMRHKNGSWRSILGRGSIVEYDASGNPVLMSGTNTDISDRKRLEEQLHQSQKMESIGRLAGGVAHDFNNMLGVILGYAQLSLLKLSPTDRYWNEFNEISKAAERSCDITRQLLAFSRKEVITPKLLNLNSLISDSQKNLGRLIGEDVKLAFKPAAGLWTIKADPTQLDQILMNLAVNARDAMPNGGTLTIETANISIDGDYSHYHLDALPGDYVLLTVGDTGCGMDQDTRERIFEPFFTTKEAGKGTGLGLATVYGIVTQNKGFINCYSEPGHGTVFRIYLPGVHDVEDMTATETPVIPLTGSGTILLVEDEEMLLWMTGKMLEELGYKVIPASTPKDALAICERGEHIDLILTDVVMPEMNGREMVERIKSFRPDVRVLFMSGYTADIVAQRGIVEEGMHYIQKPLEMKQLNEKLRNLSLIR